MIKYLVNAHFKLDAETKKKTKKKKKILLQGLQEQCYLILTLLGKRQTAKL